jgi:drug/metabolite transporter (DMT)-like permease
MSGASSGSLVRGLAYVGFGVFLFSTSPVLLRWAQALDGFQITFGRMAVAALAVFAYFLISRQPVRLSRRDLTRFVLIGLVTALHFLFYSFSLFYTTIAHSLALVYTAPIFVTILAAVFLGERIVPRQYAGLAVAIFGVALLTGFEPAMTPAMAFGDLLAVGSAVCFGIYSVVGRRARTQYPLLTYMLGVYTSAALWLLPPVLLGPLPSEISLGTAAAIVGLGIFPLGVGHTLYNASLRRVHPTYVNLIATQEVTGGVILGYLFLGEVPSTASIIGAAVTILGIAIVLVFRQESKGTVVEGS